MTVPLPHRSLLYVPGSRPEMLEKIPQLDADGIVVDLEDGVAPGDKDSARAQVRAAAEAGTFARVGSWMLRLNASGSSWHEADARMAEAIRPPRVVLPKAEDPGVVREAGARFAGFSARTGLVIETAAGVGNARALAAAHPSVDLLIVGSADLRLSLRSPGDPERRWERHALSEILLAARAAGCEAIDGVYFRFRDPEGLRRHAAIARELGYDGKSCIHPAQVGVIHEVFSSTAEELLWAERVLASWREGEGRGVVVVDGEMIEALHVAVAERIRARR